MSDKVDSRQKVKGWARYPSLVRNALSDRLIFRPAPPGDEDSYGNVRLKLPKEKLQVDVCDEEMQIIKCSLGAGTLTLSEAQLALEFADIPEQLSTRLLSCINTSGDKQGWDSELEIVHQLDKMALVAIKIIDRAQKLLLTKEPLTEVHFYFTDEAKAALSLGWEVIAKRGSFPLQPLGLKRFQELQRAPCGTMHFVSASDIDAGYFYTMGIAQSPEAQALQKMDLTYGLDGELIVPGQAVSPIPPFLAMGTRLFAASIPTSSNISEEVHSIPMRNFPHPTAIDDLEPRRGGLLRPPVRPKNTEQAITDLRLQLDRYQKALERKQRHRDAVNELDDAPDETFPEVGAVFEVTGMSVRQILKWMKDLLEYKDLREKKNLIALYLNIEPTQSDRVEVINQVVYAASKLGLKYVAVADDVEDNWLPNLLEYLDPDELNYVADYSDEVGVVIIDGRPIDPVYTAATAAQRIQSVFTTLSVDILKMGMWLCLDALNARKVWREIISNPHIAERMLLMPIGIVEPWSAFVDNRNVNRTPRAILDPFEKIKFMIEEATLLRIPALLTDTRHKSTWVLLGLKTAEDTPHLREKYMIDPSTGKRFGRTADSAIPLLSWKEFMECEKLAREKGIMLGQAGSIEIDQAFRIIRDTTYDAAKDKRNPATAIWTAETERVLRIGSVQEVGDLQSQRSSTVAPFLAVVNRGFESHAKLDGWLRYLEESGNGKPKLRQDLDARRSILSQLLETCMKSQSSVRSNGESKEMARYQSDWGKYRQEYIAYHNLIKQNYLSVIEDVATLWNAKSNK